VRRHGSNRRQQKQSLHRSSLPPEDDQAPSQAAEGPAAPDGATVNRDVDFNGFEDNSGRAEEEEGSAGDVSFDDEAWAGAEAGPTEFDFSDEPDTTGSPGLDQTAATVDDATDEDEFVFASSDDGEAEESSFRFEDEDPFREDAGSEWGDDTSSGETFDFNEPEFETDGPEAWGAPDKDEEEGLQFGEITFSDDDDAREAPALQSDDAPVGASTGLQEEPELFVQREQVSLPSDDDEDEPQLPPPPRKKSSLSRILTLLVLLLVVLAGAAGFLFMQEGALNLKTVSESLPFLKDYIGEADDAAAGDRIGINIRGSSYVTGQAGQMLVIQGEAVNNHQSSRSSITIKALLLDAQGKTLRQQTVFCGNALTETALAELPFSEIEEAMNNEFGDSLSNMNVAAGGSIPFTIVFRNLPDGIANINVEVVDSKPGAG